jgi:hypothetical protein
MSLSPTPFNPPPGYARVKVVKDFHQLVTTPFGGGVNALCWPRTLDGNFSEVVEHLTSEKDLTTLTDEILRALPLSAMGRVAVDTLIEDQQRLRTLGLSPVLDCIHQYPRDEEDAVVPTDVYSFHADSATVETDTYLCSYTEAASEGLRNEEAQCCVDIPKIRAQLLKTFGGEDNREFREYLHECCYDLHYVPIAGAQPFGFGLGNFWRIAVDYPGSPVPPCVHRAPETRPGRPPRLLLIS